MNISPDVSAATVRSAQYGTSAEWYCDFRYGPVEGLGPEEGVHRRDPSSVLRIDGTFHVWYTKSVGQSFGMGTGDPDAKVFPWDQAEVWHATSADGHHWSEQQRAVGAGEPGSYDDRSVFTPEVLAHDGRFHLVYQVIASPYVARAFESIAMATAPSPDGPWTKSDAPLISPTEDGEWLGDEDNRLMVVSKGSFDSHKTHDPLLIPFDGRFFLYYKGEQMGEEITAGGRNTRWGVAIADQIDGPYVRSPLNPITNSGHETCLWRHGDGIAALLTTDGPERNTIQFAADGVNFEIQSYVPDPPVAAGPLRLHGPSTNPLDGIRWGLTHRLELPWHYISGYAVDERRKIAYRPGGTPDIPAPPPGPLTEEIPA